MKYIVNGKRMNATQLVTLAKKEFRKDTKGMSTFSIPDTANKAEHYLTVRTADNDGTDVKEIWWEE